MAEHQLRVNGTTLMLRENETSADEIRSLLTARFGSAEASSSRAVALQDRSTGLIFPLNVVGARPDVLAQSERLEVLFSCTPLTILLRRLVAQGDISEQEMKVLVPLADDPFVIAAFEVYQAEGDEADLIDTLQRIVAIRIGGSADVSHLEQKQRKFSQTKPAPASSRAPPPSRGRQTHAPSGDELMEQLTASLRLEEFPEQELQKICFALYRQGKLSDAERVVLMQLTRKSLPHLQAAFEVFLQEQNEGELLSALHRVAKYFGIERIVKNSPDKDLLLAAFAQGNPMVCGAWDLYVDEHNEDDFRDTLQRCGVRLRNGKARVDKNTKPTEEKTALRRFVLWLHSSNKIDTETGRSLMELVDNGSPQAENAMRTYLQSPRLDGDQENLVATVVSLVQGDGDDDLDYDDEDDDYVNIDQDEELSASFQYFLQDLGDAGKISEEAVPKLMGLVEQGDPRLLAAFDLFAEEKDEEDLCDTLERLASKVDIVGIEDGGLEQDETYDIELMFEVIAQMGLDAEQLEILRDAMEIRHPIIEAAMDEFNATNDDAALKKALVEFCDSQL